MAGLFRVGSRLLPVTGERVIIVTLAGAAHFAHPKVRVDPC